MLLRSVGSEILLWQSFGTVLWQEKGSTLFCSQDLPSPLVQLTLQNKSVPAEGVDLISWKERSAYCVPFKLVYKKEDAWREQSEESSYSTFHLKIYCKQSTCNDMHN